MKNLLRLLLILILAGTAVTAFCLWQSVEEAQEALTYSISERDPTAEELMTKQINELIGGMTLDEKIDQILMVQQRGYDWSGYTDVQYGGMIIGSKSSYDGLAAIGANAKIAPFIATDDEGGDVERAATGYPNAHEFGDNLDWLAETETRKTQELLSKGINVNLGPVADVVANRGSALYWRSFGDTTAAVETSVGEVLTARSSVEQDGRHLGAVLKHYPGYPDSPVNTDFGEAADWRPVTEIQQNIEVFLTSAQQGAMGIMLSNVIYQNLDADLPASLSPTIVGALREKFDGVIMTDDIGNAAGVANIPERFAKAFLAGNDMILLWEPQAAAAHAELLATITAEPSLEERLDDALWRILCAKAELGLI